MKTAINMDLEKPIDPSTSSAKSKMKKEVKVITIDEDDGDDWIGLQQAIELSKCYLKRDSDEEYEANFQVIVQKCTLCVKKESAGFEKEQKIFQSFLLKIKRFTHWGSNLLAQRFLTSQIGRVASLSTALWSANFFSYSHETDYNNMLFLFSSLLRPSKMTSGVQNISSDQGS
jgi:hypothetical protein